MLPTLELIKKLKDDLEENFKVGVGTFIGEIKKEKRKDELNNPLVLTNDKIFDKGIDVPDLEILINCVPLGSLVKTEQIMGRLRDREGRLSILFDITYYGFDECIKQIKIRKRFYKKKAKQIIELK